MVKFQLYIGIVLTVFFIGCKSPEKKIVDIKAPIFKGMSEGIALYEISYLTDETNNILTRLMPSELTVKFREHITLFQSSMAFDQVKANIISDLQKQEILIGIDYSGKKYKLNLKGEDTELSAHDFTGYEIIETNDTSNILGMTCQITQFASPTDTFYVEHTKDIAIDNLYWTGKMKQIKGFPLKFRMHVKDMKANVTIKELYASKFDDSTFELPEDYVTSTKQKVNSIFPLYD